MNKNNRFTLIATVLLGMLLYTILQFARDLNVAWDGSPIERQPVMNIQPSSEKNAYPVIATQTDIETLLRESGLNAERALRDYSQWGARHGFHGPDRLPFSLAETPLQMADKTLAELESMSAAGDRDASQELARQTLFVDAPQAAQYFRRASEQGSSAALLRLGSLLDTLAKLGSRTTPAMEKLAATDYGLNLQQTAWAVTVTALRDGGPPVADQALLGWLSDMAQQMPATNYASACAYSEKLLLDIAGARIKWNRPTIALTPPAFFLTVPDLSERLPCSDTANPVELLMATETCAAMMVLNSERLPMLVNICANG